MKVNRSGFLLLKKGVRRTALTRLVPECRPDYPYCSVFTDEIIKPGLKILTTIFKAYIWEAVDNVLFLSSGLFTLYIKVPVITIPVSAKVTKQIDFRGPVIDLHACSFTNITSGAAW